MKTHALDIGEVNAGTPYTYLISRCVIIDVGDFDKHVNEFGIGRLRRSPISHSEFQLTAAVQLFLVMLIGGGVTASSSLNQTFAIYSTLDVQLASVLVQGEVRVIVDRDLIEEALRILETALGGEVADRAADSHLFGHAAKDGQDGLDALDRDGHRHEAERETTLATVHGAATYATVPLHRCWVGFRRAARLWLRSAASRLVP